MATLPTNDGTYQYLEDMVKKNLGGRDDEETENIIYNSFHTAQKEFTRLPGGEWPELEKLCTFTLTTGTYQEDIGSISAIERFYKFYNLMVLDGTTWRKLQYITPDKYDQTFRSVVEQSSGTPYFFTLFGTTFWFDKTFSEDLTFQLRYMQYPQTITDRTQTLQLSNYIEVLIAMTTALCWLSFEEMDNYNKWRKISETLITGIISSERVPKNFKSSSQTLRTNFVGNYWQDPFVREV